MRYWTVRTLMYLLPLLTLGGCISMGDGMSLASPRADDDNYQLIEQEAISVTGCQYQYRVYQPMLPRTRTSVILGHGFLRDQDNMIGLSRAIANRGIQVVTLDFCNMRPWNGHHRHNAQDMRDLSQKLNLANDIIYAGFSAGALAAVLAADNDTRAIVVLDLVDQAKLGQIAIQKLQTPLIGLSGPPSGCNANSNGRALFGSRSNAAFSHLGTVAGASHCDFETPSNWLCEVACGNQDNDATVKARRESIIEKTVTSLLPYLSALNADNNPS